VQIAAITRIIAALCCLVVLAAIVAGGARNASIDATPAAAHSGLHVAGMQLVDAAGTPVLLHGVDISGTEFSCAQGGTAASRGWSIFGGQPEDTAGTIAAMQKWHINAVRVPLNEDCWLGINGINPAYGGAAYRAAIVKFVQHLRSAGWYVIVDLHWNAPGDVVALSQQPMADADHAPSFWTSVASVFAADPSVLFDLYNEPFLYGSYFQSKNQSAWSCWLNGCALTQYLTGGQPYTQTYTWQAAGMQRLIDVIRAAGASNVVIANGLNWSNDDSGWLANRPHDPANNLAAGWHEYPGEQCAAITCWSHTIEPIAQHVPVIVGETGDHTGAGCTLTNLPNFLPWADAHSVSYLAWTFNPWGDTHDVLIKDWKGTPSACEGEYYANHLAAIAANPPSPLASPVSVSPNTPSNNPVVATSPVAVATVDIFPKLLLVLMLLIGIAIGVWSFIRAMRSGRNRSRPR
jgi:endoglucanase